MNKKRLTINTLAIGNLKHRRKQYAIMIAGILLAMVFSSSVLFFIFSLNASQAEMKKNLYGDQNLAFFEADEEVVKEAYSKQLIEDYGFAHNLGYAYTETEELGSGVAWADERFKNIQYQSLLEGEYPTADGEIAAEKSSLIRLGYEAKLGEKIKVKFKVQNGLTWLEEPVEKEFTVVGILKDKKSNYTKYYWSDSDNVKNMPSIFVKENSLVDSGGKENLVCYMRLSNIDDYYKDGEYSDKISDFAKFFTDKGYHLYDEDHFMELDSRWMNAGLGELSTKVGFAVVLAIVLFVASGLIIINSFNANLKERKKQIGMLRAVGTTKRQIIQIFSREALIISLMCAPVSLVISIFGVKLIAKFLFDESFIFVAKWWILIVCIIFSICAVMVAALIPLLSASKITPMQAIRNIDAARKLKNKKVKTQKQYRMESLLAKRNEALHRGSRFAVIFILIITIVVSCAGFTELKEEYDYSYNYGYDYQFWGLDGGSWGGFINYTNTDARAMSENDRQEILSFPYIKSAEGTKSITANLVIPEYNDYFTALEGNWNSVYQYDDENSNGEWWLPSTKDEWNDFIKTGKYTEEYSEIRQRFNLQGEYFPSNITAVSPAVAEELSKAVSEGKINTSKLNTGEEIILIAPKRAAFRIEYEKRYESYNSITDKDDDIRKDKEYFVEGEIPYRVGDKITLDILTSKQDEYGYDEGEDVDSWLPTDLTQASKEVTIGAIITPDDYYDADFSIDTYFDSIGIFTTVQGLENFMPGVKYGSMQINAAVALDDETDEVILDFLDPFAVKYNGEVHSVYKSEKESKAAERTIIMSLAAIIILFFAISASIINNTLAASIRENKREIGTLRAVGASSRELVMSYIKQLISMFAWGYGLGFLVSILIFVAFGVYTKVTEGEFAMPHIVLAPALVMCILLFVICSLNLWSKVHKEMKNSIVENIREL